MGKSLLKLLAGPIIAASALLGGCIDSNIPIRGEIDSRISVVEKQSNQENKERIIRMYHYVDDAFERYQPINYTPTIAYFNQNQEQIIRDFGGIEKIHEVLPWTKKQLKDVDKAALAKSHQEYVAFKNNDSSVKLRYSIRHKCQDTLPIPYTLFTK